jgi:hypothetical protein
MKSYLNFSNKKIKDKNREILSRGISPISISGWNQQKAGKRPILAQSVQSIVPISLT